MDYSKIYNRMSNAVESIKYEKFVVFVETLRSGLEKDLNNNYSGTDHRISYDELLKRVKDSGFRVFRNSNGIHELIVDEDNFTLPDYILDTLDKL